MDHTVRFIDEDVRITVPEGTTLLLARAFADLDADAPCGGRGSCGKCTASVRAPGDAKWRRVLMCQTYVEGDLEVRVPRGEAALRVVTDAREAAVIAWDPVVRGIRLNVSPCARGESTADWTRLAGALADAGVPVDGPELGLCASLGSLLSRTNGALWAVAGSGKVLALCEEAPRVFMAAFDLGTTSIAGYLIDADRREVVASEGVRNPQARYGGDVISRADYALNHGAGALCSCVREALDALLGRMCAGAGVPRESVFALSLAGNTAMHHLFFGISPDSLVKAPYNPTLSQSLILKAADWGLRANPLALLFALPVIGGFVGADTVACLLSGDWLNRETLTLLIDIGTNGELVLGDRHRRVACSTAAGPALEGARIACGMQGAEGAIDRIWLENGELRWHVIGEGAARGICGSGLVDLVAALLETGELDGSGRLVRGGRRELGDTGVYLTQAVVREVQLAKAAIAAGVRLMAERLGVALSDIEEVAIAGAFGSSIDPDSACAIGLIPSELRERVVQVGNAAGAGAQLALMSAGAWVDAERLARETEFLELAMLPQFQDEFVEQLNFSDDEED